MKENDQNLWDIMNDTIVAILADENMCVALYLRFCPPRNEKALF